MWQNLKRDTMTNFELTPEEVDVVGEALKDFRTPFLETYEIIEKLLIRIRRYNNGIIT